MNLVSRSTLLLGQCLPCIKQNTSKFKIIKMELDPNLLMYFRKIEVVYAFDPEQKSKTGDIVLIEQLAEKMTTLITHKVKHVVYPLGDITDPVTGRKVVSTKYRDELERKSQLYGKNKDAFDYDKAPKRGWQEDKKDFTHRESHIKYHIDENNDQPYAV